ncbi:hypothetical protein Leryth_016102 [Lithospermum erythrorhizon]|nr:hypothetical protein Leryth_016102 [Lithospermum erythrorhizon]
MTESVGPDFDIPDEILSVIPTDPFDQLDLARKITSLAIGARVTKLEAEVDFLKEKVNEKDRIIVELEDKTKLVKERDILAMTAKKLSRDFVESVDIGTDDQSVSKGYGLKGTPKEISTSSSPRGYSAAGSPRKYSSVSSPTVGLYIGSGSISSWFPSSQQSSASSSPRARPLSVHSPRMNGKEFFRHARSRLSYEQFSAFLANVKELNAKKQSREEMCKTFWPLDNHNCRLIID